MSEADFAQEKESLALKKLEKPKSLGQECVVLFLEMWCKSAAKADSRGGLAGPAATGARSRPASLTSTTVRSPP